VACLRQKVLLDVQSSLPEKKLETVQTLIGRTIAESGTIDYETAGHGRGSISENGTRNRLGIRNEVARHLL
jgi:hypothetical protein